jgi:hypothetical protein
MQKSSWILMGVLIVFSVTILAFLYSIKIEEPKGYIPPTSTGAGGMPVPAQPTGAHVDMNSGSVVITKTPKKEPTTVKTATFTVGENLTLFRDPFYSARRASGQSGDTGITSTEIPDFTIIPDMLILQGVWISGNSRSAFINDQTVQEGGFVAGWKVVRINQDAVFLQQGGVTKKLKVEE